ncbi:hypothetical protein DKG74_01750 [Zavarzinia aquatilis]|uniref:Internalin n=1 Tax=Zavarzinia aquatilis TaxID=2211142 RepID=A0A317EI18_9PROT|nr:hypothetical protein DKG74_01750 [Zavarzinia aquatilis]
MTSLDGVQYLAMLQSINLDTVRGISSVKELALSTALKRVNLNNLGAIDTLKPLRALPEVEMLNFVESTNITDGDIAVLAEFPMLKICGFMNRRHYNMTREELSRQLAIRG